MGMKKGITHPRWFTAETNSVNRVRLAEIWPNGEKMCQIYLVYLSDVANCIMRRKLIFWYYTSELILLEEMVWYELP